MNPIRAILVATLLVATVPLLSTATAGPLQVCVTDPFTFDLSRGDCGPEESWVEVSYTHSTTHVCVNTRIDGDIPFCNPPEPSEPPACETQTDGQADFLAVLGLVHAIASSGSADEASILECILPTRDLPQLA